MRGLKRLGSAGVIAGGHAFVQILRRGHHELAIDVPAPRRLADAFAELALAVRAGHLHLPGRRLPSPAERTSAAEIDGLANTVQTVADRRTDTQTIRSDGVSLVLCGPGRIRTCDTRFRRPADRLDTAVTCGFARQPEARPAGRPPGPTVAHSLVHSHGRRPRSTLWPRPRDGTRMSRSMPPFADLGPARTPVSAARMGGHPPVGIQPARQPLLHLATSAPPARANMQPAEVRLGDRL
jgi:hypothetical protein